MKRQTLETILKLFNSSSYAQTRPYLNTVHFKKLEAQDKIALYACNGMILNKTVITDDLLYNLNFENFSLRNDSESFLKQILKDKTKKLFKAVLNDEKLIIEDIPLALCTREYPKAESVIPTNLDGRLEIAFNPELLHDLVNSINREKRITGIRLLIDANAVNSPIVVKSETGNGNEFLGVLMPMKV